MMTMPNQLYNAENENITVGVLCPSCTNNEFVKNTNSVSVGARSFLFRRVGLATNGVCVFGALTSVSALFVFMGVKTWQRQWEPWRHLKSGMFRRQQSASGVEMVKFPVPNRIGRAVLGIFRRKRCALKDQEKECEDT